MTKKLRWGILATGGIARSFTKDLQLTGRVVTAVGSRSLDKARAYAAEFGIAHAHGSYEALVADPEVDAIYIATPHPMHADNAKLALNAGKHVLIEKPFTINAREAQQIMTLAASRGLVALEAMWTRFLPHMIRIREIVAAGDARRDPLGRGRPHAGPARRSGAPAQCPGARRRCAARSRHLPDLVRLGHSGRAGADPRGGAPPRDRAPMRRSRRSSSTGTARCRQRCRRATRRGRTAPISLAPKARIEIEGVWYAPTTFRVLDPKGSVLEAYDSKVEGRGMQYEAEELERLVAIGATSGEMMPIAETVGIMGTLDAIRAKVGLKYPTE